MIIKKLLACLFTILISSTLSGQEWAPLGATWYYSFDGFGVEGYVMIESTGDTVISGQTYRVLVKTQHSFNYITSTYFHGEIGREYTYAENDKVYVWRNNVVYILYDFGTQQGEEWEVPYTYEVDSICDTVGIVQCVFSDTATLNGFPVRIMLIAPAEESYWGFGENGEVIEYIGNTSFYLFPNITGECPIADLGEGGEFRCYHDDIIGWYTTVPQGECDYLVGVEELRVAGCGLQVYPNPCRDVLKIRYKMQDPGYSLPAGQAVMIEIYNISGNKVLALECTARRGGVHETGIDLSDLSSGIYFLRIESGNKVMVQKIVKME